MTDSMGPGKLVRHMQNPSCTYDTYFICMDGTEAKPMVRHSQKSVISKFTTKQTKAKVARCKEVSQ